MKLNRFNERHCYVNFVNDNPFLFIEAAGVTEPDPDYGFTYRTRMKMSVFEYIQTGHGFIEHDNKKYRLSPGDFCIMRRGMSDFHYYSDPENPYRKLWFSGCGRYLDSLMSLYEINEGVTIIRAPEVEERFKRMIDELYRFGFIERNIVGYLSELFWELMRSEVSIPKKELAVQVHSYIDFKYTEIENMSRIAQLFRMSERQLTRIFTEAYGITPWAYVIECRLGAAAGMLISTEMKIADIASACGYKSFWHFDREFAKKYDMSPSEYRKRRGAAASDRE